jgi:hypothetical protein
MPVNLKARLQPVHKILITGAWFFVIVSLLNVALGAGMLAGNPSDPVRLYSSTVGGETFDAWGLTYSGAGGMVHAFSQILFVLIAATASMVRPTTPRRLKARRYGLIALTVWAGLWIINMLVMAGFDGTVISTTLAGMMSCLFGCTTYRTVSLWSGTGVNGGGTPRKATTPAPEKAPAPDAAPPPADAPARPNGPSSPTREFFAAIAPDPAPAAAPASASPSRSGFAAFRFNVGRHVNGEKLCRCAAQAGHSAKRGCDVVFTGARRFGRRARPVARTAWRESKNAWRKTLDALKDAEQPTAGAMGRTAALSGSARGK